MNFKYLLRSILNIAQPRQCPYCGGSEFKVIDSKYIVTKLLKCTTCALQHRHPRDSKEYLDQFYQSEYSIDVAMMTALPTDTQLAVLKQELFPELPVYADYIKALPGVGNRVIDYGCSWGYNVYKMQQAGLDVQGYELSKPRAKFGEKLQLKIATQESDIRPDNDVFFSSHVIEHLPNIHAYIQLAASKLTKDGYFIAFCPNGSQEYREREPDIYHVNWGFLHPNFLDIEFAKYAFRNNPYLILTGDWDHAPSAIAAWDGTSQKVDENKSGQELLIIARPHRTI